MINKFAKLFENLTTVLTDVHNTDLLAIVPKENIRPNFDGVEPLPGGVICYGWGSLQWVTRYRRGVGVLAVNCESPKSAAEAVSVLTMFQTLINAQSLSSSDVTVAFFQENPQGQYGIPLKLNRHVASTNFEVRLI